MTRVYESKPDKSILEAVAELEKIDFTPHLLAVSEYNKRMLKSQVQQVKEVLGSFGYPYNRKVAGTHGHFTKKDYGDKLQNVKISELVRTLARLAQLNQAKIYLFWTGHKKYPFVGK